MTMTDRFSEASLSPATATRFATRDKKEASEAANTQHYSNRRYTWYKTWAMFDVISPRRACTTFITVHNQPYTLALENDETLLS